MTAVTAERLVPRDNHWEHDSNHGRFIDDSQDEVEPSVLDWDTRVLRFAVHTRWFPQVLAGLGISDGLDSPNAIRFCLFL